MKAIFFTLLKKLYRYRSAAFFVFFSVCAGLYAIKTGFILSSGNSKKTVFSLFFCLSTLIVVITTGIVYFRSRIMLLHKQFAVLFLTFGTLFLIVIPTWTVPDSYAHWYRIFEISRGHIVSAVNPDNSAYGGQLLPKGTVPNFNAVGNVTDNYAKLASTYNDHLDNSTLEWVGFAGSALYSPVTYLFQLPGVWLSALLTDRPFVISFAGRISAFILSFLLLFSAIKRLPVKKMLFLFLSLTPMFLQEATSLAGDALINASSMAVVAFSLYYASENIKKISVKEIMVICFLALVISLGKIVYLPILALFFLIPASKFSSKRTKLTFLITLSFIAVLLNLTWLLIAKQFLIGYHIKHHYLGNTSAELVLYAISHPVHTIMNLIRTYILTSMHYVKTFMGESLGWYNIPVNSIVINAYLLLLLTASLIDNNGTQTTMKKQLFFFGLPSLAVMFLIWISLYMQWGQMDALGHLIQGRYFIPIIFCLMFIVPNNIISTFNFVYKQHTLNFLINLSGIKIKFNQKQFILSTDAFFKIGLIIIATAIICSIFAVMKVFV